MTDRRDVLRRLALVFAALVFAAGSMLLMRMVARQVAGVVAPEPVARAVNRVEAGANAPRVYDLKTMVPEEYHYSVLGRACRRTESSYLMPVDLLRRTKDAEAVASGWKKVESGDPVVARALRRRGAYYETNDGRFVSRQYWADRPDCSHMVDIDLPDVSHFEIDALPDQKEPEITDIAAGKGARFRSRMPDPIRAVVVGDPVFTALHRREEGAVFFATTVTPLPVPAALKRVREAVKDNGWRRGGKEGDFYQQKNLSLGVDCQADVAKPGLAILSYRISDDEVRINQQNGAMQ